MQGLSHGLVVLGLGCIATVLAAAEEFSADARAELGRLQGKWRIVRIERSGKEEPAATEVVQVQVQENKVLLGEREVGLRITLLDLGAKPKLVDISHPESAKRLEGVYELADDQWKICLNSEGTAERPADFNSAANAKYVTVLLERVK